MPRLLLIPVFFLVSQQIVCQSITTSEVTVEATDETTVDGRLRVTGDSQLYHGRVVIDSDKPRIHFRENDNVDENFRMQVQNGVFKLHLTDENFASTGLGLQINGNGRSTFQGGLVIKDGFLSLPEASTLTISNGEITVTGSRHRVDTEGGTASDNLHTINFASGIQVDGAILFLTSVSSSRDVVLKHQNSGGNISSNDHGDTTLNTANVGYMLIWNGAMQQWLIVNPK